MAGWLAGWAPPTVVAFRRPACMYVCAFTATLGKGHKCRLMLSSLPITLSDRPQHPWRDALGCKARRNIGRSLRLGEARVGLGSQRDNKKVARARLAVVVTMRYAQVDQIGNLAGNDKLEGDKTWRETRLESEVTLVVDKPNGVSRRWCVM
ncbi:hypothetical protein MAPG_05185 [Magnaporthiopsis poae ATCC 64411]|uniref:Uncharacterized protein n=1 Tax=Magnaporthiopsis poae (strain ATCC 64411 / 73-15) TaxID=644358 RepID=A0A0C4DYQ9_MAGP6|nr:hypothetical protein MAPG_05185 [Magnaporthiopsis poae ATCC 64411]